MSSTSEKKFQKLAEQVDEDASGIKCSKSEYREGLETIIDRLQDSLNAAREMAGEDE